MTISETAYYSGFESVSYFIRVFRKAYHVSPGMFRRMQHWFVTSAELGILGLCSSVYEHGPVIDSIRAGDQVFCSKQVIDHILIKTDVPPVADRVILDSSSLQITQMGADFLGMVLRERRAMIFPGWREPINRESGSVLLRTFLQCFHDSRLCKHWSHMLIYSRSLTAWYGLNACLPCKISISLVQ